MIESEPRLKGEDGVGMLNRIKSSGGVPNLLHCDNGSEFPAKRCIRQNKLRLHFLDLQDRRTILLSNHSSERFGQNA